MDNSKQSKDGPPPPKGVAALPMKRKVLGVDYGKVLKVQLDNLAVIAQAWPEAREDLRKRLLQFIESLKP